MYRVSINGKIPFNDNAELYSETHEHFNVAVKKAQEIAESPSGPLSKTIHHDKSPSSITITFSDKAAVLAQNVPEKKIEETPSPYNLGDTYQITTHIFPAQEVA